jgi:hypothetical protein
MVMTPKEKKAFVARMKKGRAAAKKSGGGNTMKISKKALLNNLDTREKEKLLAVIVSGISKKELEKFWKYSKL